jgi:hypothetical protein
MGREGLGTLWTSNTRPLVASIESIDTRGLEKCIFCWPRRCLGGGRDVGSYQSLPTENMVYGLFPHFGASQMERVIRRMPRFCH